MRKLLAVVVLLCGAVGVSAAFAEDAKTDQVVGLGGYVPFGDEWIFAPDNPECGITLECE